MFIFSTTVLIGYLIDHVITLRYVSDCMVHHLKIILQIPYQTCIIKCVQLGILEDSTQLYIIIQLVVMAQHCYLIQQKKLVSFGLILHFIDSWIKLIKYIYMCQTKIYFEETLAVFKNIPVTITELKLDDYEKLIQIFLTYICV